MNPYKTSPLLLVLMLLGCGGGGDNAGTCSGSSVYCAEFGYSNSNSSGTGLYYRAGKGADVFEIPVSVKKIKVSASYSGNASNFQLKIGSLFINELLGTGYDKVSFEGTYLLKDERVAQIPYATGVTWSIAEVQ